MYGDKSPGQLARWLVRPWEGKCRQLTQSAFNPLWFFSNFVFYTWATSSAVQTEGTHLQIIIGKYTQTDTYRKTQKKTETKHEQKQKHTDTQTHN